MRIRERLRSLCKSKDRVAHIVRSARCLGLRPSVLEQGLSRNIQIGEGPYWVSAHWDVVNARSENANDNSAAIVACLELVKRNPWLSCVIFDHEEVGGLGSHAWAKSEPNAEWIINLELAGEGGAHWLVGYCDSGIGEAVERLSAAPRVRVPFNDSVTLRRNGLDACLVQPCPRLEGGQPDLSNWSRCHSTRDTVSALPVGDLELFIDSFDSLLQELSTEWHHG